MTHLVRVAGALTRQERVVVLGSSSLLATHPDLGDPGQPLETSYDADLLIANCGEEMAKVLTESIGEGSLFEVQTGYHADILRPAIAGLLPADWEDRLVPLEGCDNVFCLDPHDLAVAKLQAGCPKDIQLLAFLLRENHLDAATVTSRLRKTCVPESQIARTHTLLNDAKRLAQS